MNSFKAALVLMVGVGVLGFFVAVGNAVIGQWETAGMDALGSVMWFAFAGLITFIHERREQNRGYRGY